jgi:hypothetical protein
MIFCNHLLLRQHGCCALQESLRIQEAWSAQILLKQELSLKITKPYTRGHNSYRLLLQILEVQSLQIEDQAQAMLCLF